MIQVANVKLAKKLRAKAEALGFPLIPLPKAG
jgi:hypothetical protein